MQGTGSAGGAPDQTGDKPKLRILVVDDQADARKLLVRYFTLKGADVSASASVEEALKSLVAFAPDVLITDISMPDQDGRELVRAIRDGQVGARFAQLPAIALSGNVAPEDISASLATGFQRHLSKPVDLARLLQEVKDLAAAAALAP